MSALRRLAFGCVLACGLAVWDVSELSAQAEAPADAPASAAPVAPIAPVTGTAPAAQPVPALPTKPAADPSAPATPGAAAGPTAPTAVPPAPPKQDDEPDDEPEPTPPPSETAEPPPTSIPTSAGAGTTASADAEITLEEAPTESLDDEEKDELPWSASIAWGQSYAANGFSRDSQTSFNPEYVWDFTATLGYRFDELTSISLRQPLTVELTDSDATSSRQELWVLDTAVDATRKLWKLETAPGDSLSLSGGLGLVFPVSPSSQAVRMLLGTRAKVGFEYGKKKVMHGLSVGTGFAYLRRWATSNQVHVDDADKFSCLSGSPDISHGCTHLGGASTTRDVFRFDVHGELRPIEKLAVNASFSLGWNRGHGLNDDPYRLPSTGYVVALPDDETHWRNTRELVLGVSYDFTDWFSAAANATNGFAELDSYGKYRGPFNSVDMAFGLSLSLSIDQLYLAQRGRGAGGD